MRFGTKVMVTRGGGARPGEPGSKREVRGVLVGAWDHERYVRLEEDDPLDTVGWNKAGQVGHWSASAVRPEPAAAGRDTIMVPRAPKEENPL